MHRKLIPALLPGEGREPGEQAAVRAAAHERVDAEAAACRVDREQHVYDGEKNVIPRWRPHVVRLPRDTGSRAENPLEARSGLRRGAGRRARLRHGIQARGFLAAVVRSGTDRAAWPCQISFSLIHRAL